jgi:predicted ATPase/DNA-binding winged helix-turn-helix (wHTH) protein
MDHEAEELMTIQVADLVIECAKRLVIRGEERLRLTAKEFDLLVQFARHPGRVYSRSDLLDLLWGQGYEGYEHTVDSHINRLRAKIEADPAKPRYLLTVWGVGYKFAAGDDCDEDFSGRASLLPNDARPAAARLPVQLTRFFGREPDIERLTALLCSPEMRLVTLTGLGGAGKTRLALEVAGRLREAFPGPICFVALADLTAASRIPDAILDALGHPRSASVPPPVQVTDALHGQPSLLVLDNFEHLIEDGALYLRDLLAVVPTLTCLVTSRQRLGIAGEREFPLLPLPTPEKTDTPERLAAFAGVALFVDRAQAARPDFQVTAGNGADVAALCRRLEGIPLAIELAAARAKALTPAQMLSQLDSRFDFLVSRRQDAVPRHRTLRAALDWSCALLPAPVARFFARMSAFRGGWTLEAAEAVGEVTAALALDYLEQLQDGSLVVAEEREGGMRFRMLETVRERAAEILDDVEAGAVGRRHADYFLRLAEEAEPQLLGALQVRWLDRLEAEHDNLRAALDFRRTDGGDGAAQAGLRLAGALWRFWSVRGHIIEGRERLAAELSRTVSSEEGEATREHAEARARALNGAGNLADHQGDYAAARSLYEECLALRRRLEDRAGVAVALNNLGQVAYDQGDYARAHSLFDESLALWWELGSQWGIAYLLDNKGLVARSQGDDAAADSLFEVSLAIRRELGDKWAIGASLVNLGIEAGDAGDTTRARSLLEESVALWRELGDRRGAARCLDAFAEIWGVQGESERAARLLGVAEALREAVHSSIPLPERARHDRCVAAMRAALGEEALACAWAEGRAMTLEQAVACALEAPGQGRPS